MANTNTLPPLTDCAAAVSVGMADLLVEIVAGLDPAAGPFAFLHAVQQRIERNRAEAACLEELQNYAVAMLRGGYLDKSIAARTGTSPTWVSRHATLGGHVEEMLAAELARLETIASDTTADEERRKQAATRADLLRHAMTAVRDLCPHPAN